MVEIVFWAGVWVSFELMTRAPRNTGREAFWTTSLLLCVFGALISAAYR